MLRDAALILSAGIGFGLLANFVSPRGLSLRRDYFPATTAPLIASPAGRSNFAVTPATGTNGESLDERLARDGLKTISAEAVLKAIENPLYQQDLIVLIDARDDRHYAEGHIPGAYQFDRYYPDKYLPIILPLASSAEQIIVYCNGGSCEDSEYAALALKEAGIAPANIRVYAGGILQWRDRRLPIEVGARKSGNLQPP